MNKNFRLMFIISILISVSFVYAGNVNYKYDLTLGSSPESPGQGWEQYHSVCVRTSSDGISCAINVYLWRKLSTNSYQYVVNNGENLGIGWTILRTLKSNYDPYMVTFYLWEKQGGISMNIKLSHAGTGEAKEIDCRDFSRSLTDQGYVFGSRAAVQRFGGPVTSDVCLYQKEFKECSDEIDNDNDRKKDLNDNGCIDANDDNEFGEPIGYLDGSDCNNIFGWSCDPDDFNAVGDVHLYVDGPVGAGGTFVGIAKTNVERESDVGNACGGNSNHGYSFALPNSLKDGVAHKIYAYGINIGTTPSNNVELTGTPLTFTCRAKCDATQTIFKTLTEKSSNAALYNDASFFNQICYNNIFGDNYQGTNPHSCIPDEKNVVLWLKTVSDSKVSTTKDSEFTIPVCYGDLKCRVIDTSQSQTCSPSEEIVASLASTTNSLVSERDLEINNPAYPIKICCKSQISLNSAYWTNMIDEQISQTDITDEVNLIAFGNKLENEEINFRILKGEYRLGLDFLAKDRVVAQETTRGFFTWRAGEDLQGIWNSGNYYFQAILNGDANSMKESEILIVSAPENNNPPFANIVSPENGNIFFLGEQIQFTQNSYDIDDGFEYTWDFGDGISLTGNSQALQNYNPIHTYTGVQNLGQKLIQLTVKDDRGLTSSDTVSILILNSETESRKYIFSFIIVPENGGTYKQLINYDASKTYAIDVTTASNGCTKTITCFAGLCPTTTTGTPPCYSSNSLTGPVSISSTPQPYDPITFCWKHDNENEDCNNGVLFDKLFRNTGLHNSKLNAKLTNPDSSSSYESKFFVFFDKPECKILPEQNQFSLDPGSYWMSSDNSPDDSFNNCYKEDGIDSNGNSRTTCCLNGFSCNNNNQCVLEQNTRCSDFKTEIDCKADDGHKNIAESQVSACKLNNIYGNNGFCQKSSSCNCQWDSTNNTCNNIIKEIVKYERVGDQSKTWNVNNISSEAQSLCSSNIQDIIYECNLHIKSNGDCSSGKDFYTESWTVEYLEVKDGMRNVVTSPITDPNVLDQLPEECKQSLGSRTVSCERVVRLPFFDFKNLILSILFLMIIYYFVLKKKK